MSQFFYKARKNPREMVSGIIEAQTMAQAVARLTDVGQMPVEIKPFEEAKAVLPADGKVKSAAANIKVPAPALYQFTKQLADLLEAGVPLARCMELLGRQRRFPVMAAAVEAMGVSLQQGGSLSFALAKYPEIFSPLYVHTVEAAEASGRLPLVLGRLAKFLEADMHIRSKITSSLLYPAIIFCVGVLTVFVLLSFVLPRLTVMFEDFDAQLPLVTRIVVAVSGVFAHFWWLAAGLVGGAACWMSFWLKTPKGKAAIDGFSLKVPFLKSFVENTQLSRFARTLGMLLESGVPIVTALESVTLVVDNSILQEEVRKMAFKVRSGMSLAQAVKTSGLFPEVAVDLIAVGQEGGRLEKGLYQLAAQCEESSQTMAQAFVTVLGPAVLVVVVGIVGFMMVSMLLPMFQMNMIIN